MIQFKKALHAGLFLLIVAPCIYLEEVLIARPRFAHVDQTQCRNPNHLW
jgi:hypothetical protein